MMNDFTKEELLDLECWLRVTSKQDIILPSNKELQYLQDKIQSMINDYCEHKNTRNGDPCLECCDCGRQIIK